MGLDDLPTIISQQVEEENKGRKNDQGKPMVALLVPQFIWEVAKVLTFGADKYGKENWKNDLEKDRILSALYRHTLAYHQRETHDPETGLSHLAHVACNAMFLFYYEEVKPNEHTQ
ncbi:MAG: dATP/dGTP diphosphohydrolase domain-containing protein [Candidatus Bathyarchaeia archaeon]